MPDFPVTEDFVRTANAVQLHDEARGNATEWPASFTYVDGGWVYRVERADVNADAVRAALRNHIPNPNHGMNPDVVALRDYRRKPTVTAAETAAALKRLLDLTLPREP